MFGGTVKIAAEDKKIWVFRNVIPKAKVGDKVAAGEVIAAVARWDDGPEHAHIEVWKTQAGGYRFENLLDPLPVFRKAKT